MSARPATSTSGFGLLSVSGFMRVPKPAASTIAVLGWAAIYKTFNGGTLTRYQAASGASAGCASERCR
jgi:hypothetical protein